MIIVIICYDRNESISNRLGGGGDLLIIGYAETNKCFVTSCLFQCYYSRSEGKKKIERIKHGLSVRMYFFYCALQYQRKNVI